LELDLYQAALTLLAEHKKGNRKRKKMR